jgi:hypothetical protein
LQDPNKKDKRANKMDIKSKAKAGGAKVKK